MSLPKWANWLGLAKRAGALTVGAHRVKQGLADRRVHLVLLASDAGAAITRDMRFLAQQAGVAVAVVGNKGLLGHATGEPPVAVLGLTRMPLAKAVLAALLDAGGKAPDDSAEMRAAGDTSAADGAATSAGRADDDGIVAWLVPPPQENGIIRLKRRQRAPGGIKLGGKRQR